MEVLDVTYTSFGTWHIDVIVTVQRHFELLSPEHPLSCATKL